MPDERRHESSDLDDYEVQEPSDSLSGDPGYDPLDRGVAPPERWSAGMRYGVTADEQSDGESLDQLLAEEEPDDTADRTEDALADADEDDEDDDDLAGFEDVDEDEDAGDEDVDGLLLDDGPDPRAGLVAEDEGAHPDEEEDLVATDAGFAGGAATAEEAAVHVVEEDDYDIRSE